jgi:hypothetical protein
MSLRLRGGENDGGGGGGGGGTAVIAGLGLHSMDKMKWNHTKKVAKLWIATVA